MSLTNQVSTEFASRFGSQPTAIVRSPGRVNLIGEHTDYNDGFVLPMAIDRAAWIALKPRTDHQVNIYSLDFEQEISFSLDQFANESQEWAEYMKGVAWALQDKGYSLQGWDGIVAGNIPIGAGLSSSAALELVTARAFACVSGFDWDAKQMALLSQKAENKWVGVNCGIMDQMISAAGKADHALLIDCRSLDSQLVPLPPGTSIVVLDTATRRGLVDSAYNERRSRCEEAARIFGVKALRDISLEQFEVRAGELDDMTRKRARHVISENARTQQAVEVMRQGDAQALGELMDASHVSLRDDFEVSSDALNVIVECAQHEPACYGARMTGAGFGGCAVALVKADEAGTFADHVAKSYQQSSGIQPNIYLCHATNGAEVVS